MADKLPLPQRVSINSMLIRRVVIIVSTLRSRKRHSQCFDWSLYLHLLVTSVGECRDDVPLRNFSVWMMRVGKRVEMFMNIDVRVEKASGFTHCCFVHLCVWEG